MGKLWAESLVSAETKKPLVRIRYNDFVLQISTAEAREWALNILACAEAGEQDAFFVHWLEKNLGFTLEDAVRTLGLFREDRKKYFDNKSGTDEGNSKE